MPDKAKPESGKARTRGVGWARITDEAANKSTRCRCGVCGGKGPSRENALRQSRCRTLSRRPPVTSAAVRTCSCTLSSRQEPDALTAHVGIREGGVGQLAPLLDLRGRGTPPGRPLRPSLGSSGFGRPAERKAAALVASLLDRPERAYVPDVAPPCCATARRRRASRRPVLPRARSVTRGVLVAVVTAALRR